MPSNTNNSNNNNTVLATPNSTNNEGSPTNSPKSKSSAEGTRRVNPGTGKPKTKAQIQAAVMMQRAKKLINSALNIKSMPPEFNPLIKIMKRENFANENAKDTAIKAYIEEIRTKRLTKKVKAKTNTPANTTANKPKRTYVRKPKVVNNANKASVASVASSVKKTRAKVEIPSAKQSQYKTNMSTAKKFLNHALGIKSAPPEYTPLVTIMRKEQNSAEQKTQMNAHVEKIRLTRAEKAAKKVAKGGNYTRKNRS